MERNDQPRAGFDTTIPGNKGLKADALGYISNLVIAVASTAPAYSLAATLGLVVATANGDGIVGVKAPGVMLLAFIPMYFIAVAYAELNSREPDCGTTFTWATRAFGPQRTQGAWGHGHRAPTLLAIRLPTAREWPHGERSAARRLAVADDAIGTGAEVRAGVFGTGGDPAVRVAAPGELGE